MLPVYNYMDPHQQPLSDQRNYMFPPYHHYPSNPHQMKMEPPRIPMYFEPSSYSGSYCYPSSGCHGCCNYNCYSPGYSAFRPPFPHLSSPPMFHGPHFSYHESYPAYFAPPHYSAEVPRYEYDKKTARDHCCDCPNHFCNRKSDNTMKIEEEPPEVKLHESEAQKPGVMSMDSENPSLKLQNYPYPIVWIPPDYMKDKEAQKSSILKPQAVNEESPLDINSRYLEQGGEEKRGQHMTNEKNANSSPFPLIWMPGYGMPLEVKKEPSVSPGETEERQPNIRIVPLKSHESDDHRDKPRVNREEDKNKGQSELPNEEIKPKDVLAKKSKGESKDHSGEAEKVTKIKSIPVKQITDKGVEESSESKVRKQPASPGKASLMPPICLRVDPLPKRKNGSGSSRSPSPPASRDQPTQAMSTESVEDKHKVERAEENKTTPVEAHEKKHQQDKKQHEEARVKTIEVVNLPTRTEDGIKLSPAAKFGNGTGKGAEDDDRKKEVEQNKLLEKDQKKGKVLSGTDAAIRIQSAYRGYEVRKWEPLKKLRQITRVRELLDDIRNRIKELETSSWSEQDKKQKVVIGEMIMSLLLQLDTIQGLHPSVREVRKVVARELTHLQEKLDSLAVLAPASKTRISESILDEKPGNEHGLDTKESTLCISALEDEEGSDSKESTLCTLPVGEEKGPDSCLNPDSKMREPLLDERVHLDKSLEDTVEIPVVSEGETLSEAMEPVLPEAGFADSESSAVCEYIMPLPSRIDGSLQSEKNSVQSETVNEASVQSSENDAAPVAPLVLMSEEEGGDLGPSKHQEETLTREEVGSRDHLIDRVVRPETDLEDVKMPEEKIPSDAPVMEAAAEESEVGVAANLKSHVGGDDLGSCECAEISSTSQLHTTAEESNAQILIDSVVHSESDCIEPPAIGGNEFGVVEEPKVIEAGEKQVADLVTGEHPGLEGCCSGEWLQASSGEHVTSSGGWLETELNAETDSGRDLLIAGALESVHAETVVDTAGNTVVGRMDKVAEASSETEGEPRSTEVPPHREAEKDEGVVGDNYQLEEAGSDQRLGNEVVEISSADAVNEPSVEKYESDVVLQDEFTQPGLVRSESFSGDRDSCDPCEKEKASLEANTTQPCEFVAVPESHPIAVVDKSSDVESAPMPVGDSGSVVDENEKLRELVEKLIEAGKDQLKTISDLNGRVRDLERRLSKKKKVKVRRQRRAGSTCARLTNDPRTYCVPAMASSAQEHL